MTPEQLTYVKEQLASGIDVETLKNTLRQNGYGEQLIEQLIVSVQPPNIPAPPSTPIPAPQQLQQPEKKSNLTVILFVIIGVFAVSVIGLAIIVLSSLNSARDSGMDASIKQTLATTRSQAELYYNYNELSYAGLCASSDIRMLLNSLDGSGKCIDSPDQYRISASLATEGYYCVDSLGVATETTFEPTGYSCE